MLMDGKTEAELVEHIARVASRPPQEVVHWLQRDAKFREMCEEYERCRAITAQWRSSLSAHVSQIGMHEERARELALMIDQFFQDHSAEGQT
jgi:hypothetical protein